MRRARSDQEKDDRRQALLTAALGEFFDKGFSAARMDDIAGRADLSKGTLYLYFDSKDALFRALIETLTAPNLAQIEAITLGAPSFFAALDNLATFAPNLVRHSDMPRLMKVLIGDSHAFPDTVQRYREEVLDKLLGILARAIERAHARGEIDAPAPGLAARLIIAPIAISGLWRAVFGRDPKAAVDLEALFALHVATLKRGWRPHKTETST